MSRPPAAILVLYAVVVGGTGAWLVRRRVTQRRTTDGGVLEPPLVARPPVEQWLLVGAFLLIQSSNPMLQASRMDLAAGPTALLVAVPLVALLGGVVMLIRRRTVLDRQGLTRTVWRTRTVAWPQIDRVYTRQLEEDLAFERDGCVLMRVGYDQRLSTPAGERSFDELVEALRHLLAEVRPDLELEDGRPTWLRRRHASDRASRGVNR